MTGTRVGRLTVIAKAERTKSGKTQWLCKCDCGNEVIVSRRHLKDASTKSCGCYRREHSSQANRTHGMRKTRLYRIWTGIKDRCNNPKSKYWKRYGGRGITVCENWNNSFDAFYEWATNNGYTENLTLDRKDNDLGYCPENCRWATYQEQENNRSNNVLYLIDGETLTLAQLSRKVGLTRAITAKKYKENRIYERKE